MHHLDAVKLRMLEKKSTDNALFGYAHKNHVDRTFWVTIVPSLRVSLCRKNINGLILLKYIHTLKKDVFIIVACEMFASLEITKFTRNIREAFTKLQNEMDDRLKNSP